MIRNISSNLIAFLLLSCYFLVPAFAKTYSIGDTIEVVGTIEEGPPYFLEIMTTCIKVEPPIQVKSEFKILPERNRCNEADQQTYSYNIGYGDPATPYFSYEKYDSGSIQTLDPDNEEMQKWREKIGIDRFIIGKKVKMQAKIGLCDQCHRLCRWCNVCCLIYLEPIKIEILGEEKTP